MTFLRSAIFKLIAIMKTAHPKLHGTTPSLDRTGARPHREGWRGRDGCGTLGWIALLIVLQVSTLAEGRYKQKVSSEIQARTGYGLEPSPGVGPEPHIPPGTALEDGLTEEESVALALWNNATLRETLAGLGLAQADLAEAGLLVNPHFQVLFPVGIKPLELLLIAPIQALWERPKRVASAQLTLESVGQQLVQNGLNLVRDVRLAYADYAALLDQTHLTEGLIDLTEEIAELYAKRLEAGDIGTQDLQLARLEAISARDRAVRVRQDADVAWERLRTLIGLPVGTPPVLPTGLTRPAPLPTSDDTLVQTAYRARPDLRGAELAVESAGKRLGWVQAKTFAMVAPLLSSKEVGNSGLKSGPGISADIPFFDRGQGRISRSKAELEQLALRYVALKVQIASETVTAAMRLRQEQDTLERLQHEALPAAEEAVRLSQRAYDAGEISYLEVQLAKRPLVELQLREAIALAGVRKARAELDRAVGEHL
ncbi:MAG: TolC family protein [Acidobacteriota bacterium]